MLNLNVRCPNCGEMYKYTFKTPGRDIFHIGDILGDTSISLFRDYSKKCAFCHKMFFIYELIENGRLVNILINPSREEVKDIEKGIFKTLNNYPDYYKPSFIKSVLYGPNTQVVPSQFTTDLTFKIGDEFDFFDVSWTVKNAYKIIDKDDRMKAHIYELSSTYFGNRLLVLRDDCLPELKEVNWDVSPYLDHLGALKGYLIPKDCEVVIDLS